MKAFAMMLLLAALGSAAEMAVDKNASSLQFVATQIGIFEVKGTFSDFRGTVEVVDGMIKDIEGEIIVLSLTTDNGKRDDNLLSSDFFYAVKYPTFSMKSRKITDDSIEAEMTIKGIMHNVHFIIERKKVTDEGVEIVLKGVIDRTIFDLNTHFMSVIISNDIDVKARISAH
jgi:polyisoprenoid-binding protein YceI